MQREMNPASEQRGLTLIELMVAMALGLMVITVVLGVFINTNRNFRQDEMIGRMQENARYAMRVLAQDVSMIGFWGYALVPGDISIGGLTASVDCGAGATSWVFVLDPDMQVVENVTTPNATYDCINDLDFEAGTDILYIKRVEGMRRASTRADAADDGSVFLRTSGIDGTLVNYSHTQAPVLNDITTPGPLRWDWRYLPRIYHIRNYAVIAPVGTTPGDNIPTLYRMSLSGTGMIKEGGGVAQGIEDFRVMFGYDSTGDGIPDIYSATPTPPGAVAVTARIYILARTMSTDGGYNNAKTYQLGDITRNIDVLSDGLADGVGDGFRRRVFVTTIKLRNPVNAMSMGL